MVAGGGGGGGGEPSNTNFPYDTCRKSGHDDSDDNGARG